MVTLLHNQDRIATFFIFLLKPQYRLQNLCVKHNVNNPFSFTYLEVRIKKQKHVQCVNRCEIQALLEKFQIPPNFSVPVTPSFSIFHCIRQEGTLKVFPMEYYASSELQNSNRKWTAAVWWCTAHWFVLIIFCPVRI